MSNLLGPEEINNCATPMHMGKVYGGFTVPHLHSIQLFNFSVTPICSLFPLILAAACKG